MTIGSIVLYKAFEKARSSISESVRTLLEHKHLYQSVEMDISVDRKEVRNFVDTSDEYATEDRTFVVPIHQYDKDIDAGLDHSRKTLEAVSWRFWVDLPHPGNINDDSLKYEFLDIQLPDIKVACDFCDDTVQPHNPVRVNGLEDGVAVELGSQKQIFFFSYLCQSCKRESVIYVVRRQERKLTIVGRSRFESVPIPNAIKNLPEDRFYRDAVIAFNTGRTLASLFYLRTLIEQYLRRVLAVDKDEKIRGEDLAKDYRKLLKEKKFPPQLDTLGNTYNSLSSAIHAACDDEELYTKARVDIEKHFEGLDLIPIS